MRLNTHFSQSSGPNRHVNADASPAALALASNAPVTCDVGPIKTNIMAVEDRVRARLEALLAEAPRLRHGDQYDQIRSEDHRHQCAGWLASARNLVQLLCAKPTDAYRVQVDHILQRGVHMAANNQVGEVAAILQALLTDVDQGLLASIADNARAETFGDFLDHAAAYAKEKRKNEAGTIAGVVSRIRSAGPVGSMES